MIPCFWPHALILCMPISICNEVMQAKKAALAHKLVLTTNTVKLTVQPYATFIRGNGSAVTCNFKLCTCLDHMETPFIEEMIPLTEITECKIEPYVLKSTNMLCAPDKPDTLTIRMQGSSLPVISVDAPKNGEAFVRAVNEAVARAKAEHKMPPLPEAWDSYKKIFVSTFICLCHPTMLFACTRRSTLTNVISGNLSNQLLIYYVQF